MLFFLAILFFVFSFAHAERFSISCMRFFYYIGLASNHPYLRLYRLLPVTYEAEMVEMERGVKPTLTQHQERGALKGGMLKCHLQTVYPLQLKLAKFIN